MSITVVVGEQRGDEGKGRFVDMLAADHQLIARFNGGNNAGHTVVLPDGRVLKLHLIPSGIAHPGVVNIIGNGTLINPIKLVEEIRDVTKQGIVVNPDNLLISSSAHLILPNHISEDEVREAGTSGQGSTKSGIAQVSRDKYLRVGLRAEALLKDTAELADHIKNRLSEQQIIRQNNGLAALDIEALTNQFITAATTLKPYIKDTVIYINEATKSGKKVLAEGAQAFLLDIDHGMYPFTTSSTTTSGGVATGLGIAPYLISNVVGVSKAVQSHVGGGVFVTEINDETLLAQLHGDMTTVDAEKGTTTNRVRRLGHLDIPAIRRSQLINGTKQMALTKLDWVPRYGSTVQICTHYLLENEKHDIAPDSYQKLLDSSPVYETLPTWEEDIQDVRSFDDLPLNAQKYIEFIEQQTGVPVVMIGVGPNREQVITRGNTSL